MFIFKIYVLGNNSYGKAQFKYRNISVLNLQTSCNEIRKQKELEYDIMSNTVKGWEGEARARFQSHSRNS